MSEKNVVTGTIRANPVFTNKSNKNSIKTNPSTPGFISFLKSLDIFGEQVSFTWNGEDSFKTRTSFLISLIAYSLIGVVIFNYVYLFIACTEPNVYSYTEYVITDDTDAMDLSESIYPSLLFYHRDPDDSSQRFVVDYDWVTCNFQIYAYKHSDSIITGGDSTEEVTIKSGCDTYDKFPDEMKPFYESNSGNFICLENPVIYGEVDFCTNCQYYKISLYEKTKDERSKCQSSTSDIDSNDIIVYIFNNQASVNITNYGDPWFFNLYTHNVWINSDMTKELYFEYGRDKLSDTARQFG